eukprot:TRINITY_DN2063_c0_g1_i1.p1 TRINITY_DN2063_c0_g1~~TRINITY_DN2063_c0_g1_i1.p1  ORF type:complete len:431 (-),score=79.30 TRINITY_DN2063_c0_g1_i1:71-1363(-)
MIWLVLYDVESLSHFSNNGKQLVVRREGNSFLDDDDEKIIEENPSLNPFFEIHFVVKRGAVQEIHVSIKTPTDQQATIHSLDLNIKNNKIVLGEKRLVQSSTIEYEKEYTLPDPIKEGKSFDEIKQVESPAPPKEQPQISQFIVVEVQDQVQPDQSRQATNPNGRGFKNIFYSNFHIINKTDNDFIISKVESEIFDIRENPPAWKSGHTLIGNKNGYYHYSWDQRNTGIVLRTNDLNKYVAVRTEVDLNDVPYYEQQRRAHHVLGDPVRIRVRFFDKDSREITSLIVESKNEELALATRSSVEKKYENRKSEFFLDCDDLEAEARLYVAIFKGKHNESERLEIYCQEQNNNMWLYKSNLNKLAFEALQKKMEEIPLEKPNFKGPSGQSVKGWALVDLTNRSVYALKFELITNTGRALSYYPVPRDRKSVV